MADYRDTPIEMPVLDRGGVAHNVKAYASLADAVTAAASKGGFIQLTEGTHAVADNLVIASDVQNAGGKIKPASGKTVVITGHIWPTAEGIADESDGGKVLIASEAPEPAFTAGDVFWEPPPQPSAIPSSGDNLGFGIVIHPIDASAAERYALWDALMAAAPPGYITRTLLGYDQSDTYPVYRYVFTPENYEKTIILLGHVHGNEPEGMLAIFRTMYHMVMDWRRYPQLSYLRHRVRIVVIPIVNPWGASNWKRPNSRGVNINRNFDYNWESGPDDPESPSYRGVAPWSEAETRHVRDTVLAYPDAVALIDAHALGADWGATMGYLPKYLTFDEERFGRIIRHIDPNSFSWEHADFAGIFNWAASLGLHSFTPEHSTRDTVTRFDATDMTNAVRWIGNCVIQAAQLPAKATVFEASQPFCLYARYRTLSPEQTIYIPYHADAEFNQIELQALRLDFEVPSAGLVLLDIDLIVSGGQATDAWCWFTPLLGQRNWADWTEGTVNPQWRLYTYGAARQHLHLKAQIPVARSRQNGIAGANYVRAGLAAATSDNTDAYHLVRYQARITFIPTAHGMRYREFDAAGRVDLGPDAMIQTYPAVP